MFLNKSPFFERGRILKLEMLESLRDLPRDFINIYYQDFSDGILTGCQVSASEDYLIIAPGMICYKQLVYLLKEPFKIAYTSTGDTMLLKIKFLGENRSKDFLSYTTQVFLTSDTHLKPDEMELGRFKLKAGANLRYVYTSLEDFETEYDTLNRIHVPFAAHQKSTLMPEMLLYFAREAVRYTENMAIDSSFCMNCLQNNGKVSRDVISSYVDIKLQVDSTNYSNQKLYEALVTILRRIQSGINHSISRERNGRKIILD